MKGASDYKQSERIIRKMKIAQATIPVALTFGLRFVETSANNFNVIKYRCWSDGKRILRPLVQTCMPLTKKSKNINFFVRNKA